MPEKERVGVNTNHSTQSVVRVLTSRGITHSKTNDHVKFVVSNNMLGYDVICI